MKFLTVQNAIVRIALISNFKNALHASHLKKTLVYRYKQRGFNKVEFSVFSGIEAQENRFAFLVKSAGKNRFFHGIIALDDESNWFARSFGKLKKKHNSPVLVLLGKQLSKNVLIPYKIFSKQGSSQVKECMKSSKNIDAIELYELAILEPLAKFSDLAKENLDIASLLKNDSSCWTYYCSSSNPSEVLDCYIKFISVVSTLRDQLGFQIAYKNNIKLRIYGVE